MNETMIKSGTSAGATEAASPVAAGPHADGKALLAVAEGDASHQPADAMLSHIFACDKCSASLREIRGGLLGLKGGASAPPPAELLDLETAVEAPSEEDQALERAQRMFWKLALLGGLLALGLIFLRGSAAKLG